MGCNSPLPTRHDENEGVITLQNVGGGLPPYNYSIDGVNFTNDPEFINLAPDNYEMIVQDANYCEVSQQLTIEEIEELSISVFSEDITCYSETASLEILVQESQNYDILWSTGSERAAISVGETGVYQVSVIGECDTHTEEIIVESEAPLDKAFYVPNVFSPNNDGQNDTYAFSLVDQAEI